MMLLLFFAAIWLFSAWENNLVGAWAVWTSLGIIMFPFLLAALKKIGIKNAPTVLAHSSERKAKTIRKIA